MTIGPYPKTLHHPGFRPAVLSVNIGDEQPPVSPVAFPPVVVFNQDDEDFHISRGYRQGSEAGQLPIVEPPKFRERQNFRAPIRNGVMEPDDDLDEPLSTEYPKWVGSKLVNNEAEEAIALEIQEQEAEREKLEATKVSISAESSDKVETLQLEMTSLRADMSELKSMFSEFMGALKAKPEVVPGVPAGPRPHLPPPSERSNVKKPS